MNNNNAQSPDLSSPSLNPATIQASEDAIAKTKARLIEMGGTPQEFVDPLIEARNNSPLLQFLAATQDATVLPDATIPSVPPSLSINNLCEAEAWNKVSDALTQIYAHGFEVGDTVCLRLIPAKNIPQDAFQKLRLAKAKNFDLELLPDGKCRLIPYKYEPTGENKKDGTPAYRYVKNRPGATFNWLTKLAELNRKGYGIYLLPNKGGHTDKEITHYQNAFYEVDDKSFEQQQAQLNDFTVKTGIAPSVVVRTRKSLHVYFRLYKSEWQISDWSEGVQKPTILALQSDPSIHNRARPMRLAGFYHVKYQSGEFNFQLVDMWVCNPQNEYTRAQYLQALEQYSGHKYSEARQKVLHLITTKTNQEYFYLDSNNLLPKPHQVAQCPEELIEELEKRTSAYISLLRKEHSCELVDSSDAWVKPLSELTKHRTFDFSSLEDDGEEKDIIRWAKYLYGYNPDGRLGWITGQDPTVPESECDNHSIDSLHINATTGQYKSHRGTDNSEVYRALKELAFRSNPEEKQIYSAKWKRIGEQQRKLEGQITKEEYEARGLKPELTEAEQLDNVISIANHEAQKQENLDREFAEYQERLKIKRDQVAQYYLCNEKYLSDETYAQFPAIAQCEQQGQILALKAPKGTGKSFRIKEYIKEAVAACWLTISVTIRRNLGLAQSHDWDIKWVDEDGMEVFFQGQSNTMSCCWDSLHKFHKADYRDKPILLIVDEVESGVEHLSTAKTIKSKGKRVDIYAELRRMLAHIKERGGLVLMADADLSEISVDFFRTLGKALPVTVVENTYVAEKKEIPVYFAKEGEVNNAIKAAIEFNLPFLAATDSLKTAKTHYAYAVEYLEKIDCAELIPKLWLIDSETSHTEDNKRRLTDINKAIREEDPIAIFYTPTINVGISIDVKYFNDGFGIFKGAIIPDSARQMIARNREIVPWTIFADNLADQEKKSFDTPITPEPIKKQILNDVHAQQLLTKGISKKLLAEGLEENNINVARAYMELALKLEEDRASFDTAEFHLLANVIAKHNFQMKHYHKCFVDGMNAEGWKAISKKGTKTAFCDELKEVRQRYMKKEAESIAKADYSAIISEETVVPTQLDYETAKNVLHTSDEKELRDAAYKVQVAYYCKVDIRKVDAPLVEIIKFNPRWLSAVKFHLYMQHPDIIKTIDAYKMNKLAKQYEKHGYTAPQDNTGKVQQVHSILGFGLLDVIDLQDDEQSFKKEDFIPLFKKLKSCSTKRLKEWGKECGIKINSRAVLKDPIQYAIRPMLAKLGYTLVKAKSNTKGQQAYRIPAEEINCIYRAMVLEGQLVDWREQQAQKELQLTGVQSLKLEENDPTPVLEPAAQALVTA